MRAARFFTRASALCGRHGICKSREKSYGFARQLHGYTRQATPVSVTIARASAATAFPKFRARSMSALSFRPVNAGREWDFVHQWSGDRWNCYWGEDASATFTFKPEIEVLEGGFVTFPAAGLVPEAAHAAAEQLLKQHNTHGLRVYGDLTRDDTRCDVYGSETDYPYVPVLIPWPAAEPLTAQAVLKAIGAHEQIQGRVNVIARAKQNWGAEVNDDEQGPLFEGHGPAVLRELSRRGEPLVFYAGSEKLNPVPMFVIAQLDDTCAGGFLSALVHT